MRTILCIQILAVVFCTVWPLFKCDNNHFRCKKLWFVYANDMELRLLIHFQLPVKTYCISSNKSLSVYFFPRILDSAFKWVGPLIETRRLFWKGWSNPSLIQHMLQLLSVYKLHHPPKPAAKFSVSLHVHCCYTYTCTVHMNPKCSGRHSTLQK